MRLLCATYVCTLIAMLLLDGTWLTLVAGPLFRAELGPLLVERFRLGPAILFYLLFVAAILLFVLPLGRDGGWRGILLYGAAFGAVTYMTYDLTNLATLRAWTTRLVVVDIAWGTVVTAASSTIGWWCGTRLAALF